MPAVAGTCTSVVQRQHSGALLHQQHSFDAQDKYAGVQLHWAAQQAKSQHEPVASPRSSSSSTPEGLRQLHRAASLKKLDPPREPTAERSGSSVRLTTFVAASATDDAAQVVNSEASPGKSCQLTQSPVSRNISSGKYGDQLAAAGQQCATYEPIKATKPMRPAEEYDPMIDAMLASGKFEGPMVPLPRFGGAAAVLRRGPRRACSVPMPRGQSTSSRSADTRLCPVAEAADPAATPHQRHSFDNARGLATEQTPASGYMSPFAAAATATPAPSAAQQGAWVSPFAASANAADLATGTTQLEASPSPGTVADLREPQQAGWVSPFAAVQPPRAAAAAAEEKGGHRADCIVDTVPAAQRQPTAWVSPFAAAQAAQSAAAEFKVNPAAGTASALASSPGKAAVHTAGAQGQPVAWAPSAAAATAPSGAGLTQPVPPAAEPMMGTRDAGPSNSKDWTLPTAAEHAKQGCSAEGVRQQKRYPTEAASQRFCDPAVEREFARWHSRSARTVDMLSAALCLVFVTLLSTAPPQSMAVHLPLGFAACLATHATRFLVALCRPRWYRTHRETFMMVYYIATLYTTLRILLPYLAAWATLEQHATWLAWMKYAGGMPALVLPAFAVMRFHLFLRLHLLTLLLCLAVLPGQAAILHSAVPQWDSAAFMRFGLLWHGTVSMVVPTVVVRLLMRAERKQFVRRLPHGTAKQLAGGRK